MERPEAALERARIFWPVVITVVLSDIVTKWIAVRDLWPRGVPREVFGDVVRLTLVYNRGAAFGLNVGEYSRWIFLVLTVVALVILGQLYRATPARDIARTLAIALVSGGAIGNLIDRIRGPQGVVDFIDIGIGDMRWPTFNVADMAVSTGAVLLAWVLWGEDRAERATAATVTRASNTT
ncbi:MAG TPA: signal peptidase II [Gemmatimonadaceae bacterium]|jgi:signal peptidase II|nr:signal peptidase II [Gemmatimonadaceae bacterium]